MKVEEMNQTVEAVVALYDQRLSQVENYNKRMIEDGRLESLYWDLPAAESKNIIDFKNFYCQNEIRAKHDLMAQELANQLLLHKCLFDITGDDKLIKISRQ